MSEPAGPTILLYSDDVDARAQVRLAVGRRLERDAPEITWLETATADEVITRVRTAPPDLLILDGEADKVGGMGVSRQLKEETYECPPIPIRSRSATPISTTRSTAAVAAATSCSR